MNNIITVENVFKTYTTGGSQVKALRGISFTVEKGEHIAVMGKSGSGKSTLLHVMAGLTSIDSGRIEIASNVISSMSDSDLTKLRREKIGLIFQAFNLIPTLTAEENMLLPIYADGSRSVDRNRLEMLMERLEIGNRRNHHPGEMSGGEQQRVAIGRALMADSEVLLADEPTGNLDTANSIKLCQTLKELCKDQGKTLIVVTHENDVADFADRLIVLKDGQVEAKK